MATSADPHYVTTLERGEHKVIVTSYKDETQIEDIMGLMVKDLSEPYSVFTYRYFLNGWPKYTLLVSFDQPAGVLACTHAPDERNHPRRGCPLRRLTLMAR